MSALVSTSGEAGAVPACRELFGLWCFVALVLVWGTHSAVFGSYSWFCAPESFLVLHRSPARVPVTEPRLAACQANTLTAVLSPQLF